MFQYKIDSNGDNWIQEKNEVTNPAMGERHTNYESMLRKFKLPDNLKDTMFDGLPMDSDAEANVHFKFNDEHEPIPLIKKGKEYQCRIYNKDLWINEIPTKRCPLQGDFKYKDSKGKFSDKKTYKKDYQEYLNHLCCLKSYHVEDGTDNSMLQDVENGAIVTIGIDFYLNKRCKDINGEPEFYEVAIPMSKNEYIRKKNIISYASCNEKDLWKAVELIFKQADYPIKKLTELFKIEIKQ